MKRLFIFLVLFAGCTCPSKLPNPNRPHAVEVRSDCKSWIKAWVRNEGKVLTISKWNSEDIKTLSELQNKLNEIGVTGKLKSLRYKRIAERHNEEPLPEPEIIIQFIEAAKEIVEDTRETRIRSPG